MNTAFAAEQFPSKAALQRGVWAPLLFAPNPDSPERLVIAVAAVAGNEFHVAVADAAKRLSCLYGEAATTALLVQQGSVQALEADIAIRGLDALRDAVPAFSGVTVGALREGEACSMRELATSWLDAISSLHSARRRDTLANEEAVETAVATIQAQTDNDRLPVLVYKAVEEADPQLGSYFSADIRSRARKTPRPAPQKVFIGFAGSNVVANFATLNPARPRPMIDHIKRLMWDLARHQDDEATRFIGKRNYEMIVFHRDESDPDYDEAKAPVLNEMLGDLKDQGAKDGIGVQPQASVAAIADHVRFVERTVAF